MAVSRNRGNPRVPRRAVERLAAAAARVLRWEGARQTRLELTLVDAAAMRRLNRRVTGRRGLTDVIAFTLPQPDGSVLGDVYICPAAADRYLRRAGSDADGGLGSELVRLAVHGALHVLGYDHPDGPGRTRSRMWHVQERYVRRLLDAGTD
ncbi:MAG: rRNA maturation RNase YbeY [Gemmatimonadales bacterium]